MTWIPKHREWLCEELKVTVEPYRCDLLLPRSVSWPPNPPIDFLAGTSGILHITDLIFVNRTNKALVLHFHGHSPPHATSLTTFFALLGPEDSVRVRLPFHPGKELRFGWADILHLPAETSALAAQNVALIAYGHDHSSAVDFQGQNEWFIDQAVARKLFETIPFRSSFFWEDQTEVWNEIDLLRRADFEHAVPVEQALAVAARQIVSMAGEPSHPSLTGATQSL